MGKQLSTFLIRCINFILSIYIGSIGGLGGLGGIGAPGGIIGGVPIGFGVTTTVGGFDPYINDIYRGSLAYGPGFGATGIPPPGVGGIQAVFNSEFHRGPYLRGF